MPARAERWTVQPPALVVKVVIDVGSVGVGVGVAIFGSGSGVVAMAVEPVAAQLHLPCGGGAEKELIKRY